MSDVANSIIECGKLLDTKGYTPGISGNISVKVDDKIYVTSSGSANGFLDESDIVCLDEKNYTKKPSSESLLHKKFYEERNDINAIIHVHTPYLTAFAIANTSLNEYISPEIVFCFDNIPIAKYATPGSSELVDKTSVYFKDYDVILMQNHGVIVGGTDLKDAYLKLDLAENYAKSLLFAKLLGGAKILEDSQVEDIKLLKRK